MRGAIDTGGQDAARAAAQGAPDENGRPNPPLPEWVARPERSNSIALGIAVWVALKFGRPVARAMLYPICLYFLLFSPAAYAASRKYLHKVLGREPNLADAFRHCHTFGATLVDRIFLYNDQYAQFDVRVHGAEVLDAILARGDGCFLLGAHMGSFEIIRALGRHNTSHRVSLVMYENNARIFSSVLHAINPGLATQVIALGKIDSMLKVEAALKRGDMVGMLGDRTFEGDGTVACRFLGAQAQIPNGPFRLAAMLNRPMFLMFGIYRGGNRYDVHFERLVDAWPAARDNRIKDALHSYVGRLEHYCRSAPYNWYNFYDFWR